MTRKYNEDGYRQTHFATERRYADGRTRQVMTTDWEVAKRALADEAPAAYTSAPAVVGTTGATMREKRNA